MLFRSADRKFVAVLSVVSSRYYRFCDTVNVNHVCSALREEDSGHTCESVKEYFFPKRSTSGHAAEDVGKFKRYNVHTAVFNAAAYFNKGFGLFYSYSDIRMSFCKMTFRPDSVEISEVGVEKNSLLYACFLSRFEYGDNFIYKIGRASCRERVLILV